MSSPFSCSKCGKACGVGSVGYSINRQAVCRDCYHGAELLPSPPRPEAREGCHVCGNPPATGYLTICEPDRKGADNLACCDGCARHRVVIGAVRGSTTISLDISRVIETPEDGGRPERKQYVGETPRRLGNSVAASLAENAALRAGGVAGQPATVDLVDRHFQALRLDMERLLPDGRGKAVALTQLDTARLWALSVAGEVKP